MNKFPMIISLALASLLAAGCESIKPLQAEVDTLKTQVSRL
jgi:outer membrane murein-binding lipoprotein Lpp